MFLLLRLLAAVALVVATTVVCFHLIPVNATTVALGYLVGVLLIATAWGFWEALTASLAAVACFNFFFLHPVGTFHIADPQNWIALFAFLVTSTVASHLSARAKQRTREALDREKEMERLYALSRAILLTDPQEAAAKQIAQQIAQVFDCRAVALYDRTTGETHRAGPEDMPGIEDQVRQAALAGTPFSDESTLATVIPIRLGGQPIGSLAVRGASVPHTALQALANLVAIGLERERGQEAATRAEAARQSEELKSTLLDAIAHEFNTPLTSIKAAATGLLSSPAASAEEQRELVTIVDEEADRLGRLVNEAIQMARIEAGKIHLNIALLSVAGLIETVLEQMKTMIEGRKITVTIPGDLPMIRADGELLGLAVRHLLDNAVKYSPPTSPLAISAERTAGGVTLSVCDQGPGIPEQQRLRIFEKFYRGPDARHRVTGTGMGLAIALEIARAHGGNIWVESQPAQGSKFCLSVPAGAEEMTA